MVTEVGGRALAGEGFAHEDVEVVGVEDARLALAVLTLAGSRDVAQRQRVGTGVDDVEPRAVGREHGVEAVEHEDDRRVQLHGTQVTVTTVDTIPAVLADAAATWPDAAAVVR